MNKNFDINFDLYNPYDFQIPSDLKTDLEIHLNVTMVNANTVSNALRAVQDVIQFTDEDRIQLFKYFVDQCRTDLLFGLKLIKCQNGKYWILFNLHFKYIF